MRSLLLSALVACAGGTIEVTDEVSDASTLVDTVHTGTTPTSDTTDTGTAVHTGDTGTEPVFDCATVPDQAQPPVVLEAPRGYNDVIFDVDGAMIGSDGQNLLRATAPDTAGVLLPGVGTVYKLGLLSGGDVVASRSAGAGGGVIRVAPNGASTLLGGSLLAHGLAVGSDGMVYVATNYTAGIAGIFRIDPDDPYAAPVQIVDASAFEPRDIAFSRDFSRLYWGTVNGGEVWGVDLDASLDPIGSPELVAQVPQGWHDTLEVDACGNLYVGSVFESAIYRVNTDGTAQILLDWSFNEYGHGLEWGDAAGGWSETAIYVSHPYVGSRVSEVELGVPGAHWSGTVLGGTTL